jgi:hypothetical protein
VSESSPHAVVPPRWIVHSDGRVSAFDPSQLAADLYRSRCCHKREGAALFAAELSAAVMHFAGREFASPVWRADRLNKSTADLLRELGHGETAEAWLQRPAERAEDRVLAYSPDLVGLVEEGVLDFDLRLEGARPVLKVVDALEHAGAAQSALEFLEGLTPVLIQAAMRAERLALRRVGEGVAFLRRPTESPGDVAAALVAMATEIVSSTLAPVAIDLRGCNTFDVEERLGSGPMFPFNPPQNWKESLADVIDALPVQFASISVQRIPLAVWCGPDRTHRRWLKEWEACAADRTAALVIDPTVVRVANPRFTEITVRPPGAIEQRKPDARDFGVIDAAARAAVQRRHALRRIKAVDDGEQYVAAIYFAQTSERIHQAYWRRLNRLSEAYSLLLTGGPPCRVWWGDGLDEFGLRCPFEGVEHLSTWRLRSGRYSKVILISEQRHS